MGAKTGKIVTFIPAASKCCFAAPVSNRHNHHLATRKAQEATQTKPSSRRHHSERAKRHQTKPTQALGATPPHTHAVTRCNATPHATQSLGAFKFTIFPLRTSQDVVVPSRRHNETDETRKFNEFQDSKAIPANSTNFRGFPFSLWRREGTTTS